MNPIIELNKIMSEATGDMYDKHGAEPYEKVLSTQEVQAILIDIQLEFRKALKYKEF